MLLAFNNKKLRDICEREEKAIEALGNRVAESLASRLADLDAAENVWELVAGNPKVSDEAPQEIVKIDLCDKYCIVFVANHTSNPLQDSGSVDWTKVVRIKLISIGIGDES